MRFIIILPPQIIYKKADCLPADNLQELKGEDVKESVYRDDGWMDGW